MKSARAKLRGAMLSGVAEYLGPACEWPHPMRPTSTNKDHEGNGLTQSN